MNCNCSILGIIGVVSTSLHSNGLCIKTLYSKSILQLVFSFLSMQMIQKDQCWLSFAHARLTQLNDTLCFVGTEKDSGKATYACAGDRYLFNCKKELLCLTLVWKAQFAAYTGLSKVGDVTIQMFFERGRCGASDA